MDGLLACWLAGWTDRKQTFQMILSSPHAALQPNYVVNVCVFLLYSDSKDTIYTVNYREAFKGPNIFVNYSLYLFFLFVSLDIIDPESAVSWTLATQALWSTAPSRLRALHIFSIQPRLHFFGILLHLICISV